MVQTGTERDRGNQHDRSQRRAHDGRSHRDAVGLASGLEGKPEAGRRWSWQIQHSGAAQQSRTIGCEPLTAGRPLGQTADSEPEGGKSETDEEDPEPPAEDGPVERDSGGRVEGPNWAEWTEWRKSNRHANGQQRSDGDGANNADEGVGGEGRGVGTECSQHV